jgi:septal ring-binding cell division protein DamX
MKSIISLGTLVCGIVAIGVAANLHAPTKSNQQSEAAASSVPHQEITLDQEITLPDQITLPEVHIMVRDLEAAKAREAAPKAPQKRFASAPTSTPKRCWEHVLEQQGRPGADTVLVCDL